MLKSQSQRIRRAVICKLAIVIGLLAVAVATAEAEPLRVGFAHRDITPKTLSRLYALTPREAEIAILLARGLSTNEAAIKLGIIPRTAQSHVRSILRKTETNNPADLVRLLYSTVLR